jgi:hypothetical protein
VLAGLGSNRLYLRDGVLRGVCRLQFVALIESFLIRSRTNKYKKRFANEILAKIDVIGGEYVHQRRFLDTGKAEEQNPISGATPREAEVCRVTDTGIAERLKRLRKPLAIPGWLLALWAVISRVLEVLEHYDYLRFHLHFSITGIKLPLSWSGVWVPLLAVAWLTAVVLWGDKIIGLSSRTRMFAGDVELIHAAFIKPVGGTFEKPIVEYREFMRLYVTKNNNESMSIRSFRLRLTPKESEASATTFDAERTFPKRVSFERWISRDNDDLNNVSIQKVDYGNSLTSLMDSATGRVLKKGETAHGWLLFTIPNWRWTLQDCLHELFAIDAQGTEHEIPIVRPEWESGSATLLF